jgi:AcrR family transcriptional regulator
MSTRRAGSRGRGSDQDEDAREAVIQTARRAFGRKGFNGAQLSEIVSAAGVTTGAVYHHFRDKKDLFKAVAIRVEEEILEAVNAAAQSAGPDPWTQFLAGIDATLQISAKPEIQRIAFIDAPTVIGPSAWREIEMRFAYGAMHRTIGVFMGAGLIRKGSVEVTASILLGALIEAANAVARAGDKTAALSDARATISRLIASLKV